MKTVIVVAALIIEQGKILVTQRKKDAPYGLLWEFPGGKVKEGEDPRGALQRELREELDVEAEVGMIFDAVFYSYPAYPILLLVYHCRVEKGLLNPIGCHDLRWVNLRELEELAMPPADDPIRKHLFSLGKQLPLFLKSNSSPHCSTLILAPSRSFKPGTPHGDIKFPVGDKGKLE